MSLGPIGEARGRVVADEAPRRFAFAETGWLDGAPPLLTEFAVEDLGGGRSRVRVVNRVDGDQSAQTRRALAAAEAAWRPYLAVLRLHLAEHAGATPATIDVTRAASGVLDDAWSAMLDALGWRDAVAEGERVHVSEATGPALTGHIEHAGEHEVVVRLDAPAPGYALVTAYDGGEGPLVNVHVWLYGPDAERIVAHEGSAWEARLRECFPREARISATTRV